MTDVTTFVVGPVLRRFKILFVKFPDLINSLVYVKFSSDSNDLPDHSVYIGNILRILQKAVEQISKLNYSYQ